MLANTTSVGTWAALGVLIPISFAILGVLLRVAWHASSWTTSTDGKIRDLGDVLTKVTLDVAHVHDCVETKLSSAQESNDRIEKKFDDHTADEDKTTKATTQKLDALATDQKANAEIVSGHITADKVAFEWFATVLARLDEQDENAIKIRKDLVADAALVKIELTTKAGQVKDALDTEADSVKTIRIEDAAGVKADLVAHDSPPPPKPKKAAASKPKPKPRPPAKKSA